jgi:hypothetical protein
MMLLYIAHCQVCHQGISLEVQKDLELATFRHSLEQKTAGDARTHTVLLVECYVGTTGKESLVLSEG